MTHITATFDQRAYRFRADDGNETGATWLANENTGLTDVDLDVTEAIRLRFGIQENAGGSNNNVDFTLQYRINGGTYQNVNGSTTEVMFRTSSHVANQAVTTDQLSTGLTGTFRAGAFVSASGSAARISFSGNDHGENEYSLQLVADDLSDGDTIDFRLLGDGAVLNNYTVTPTITVSFAASTPAGSGDISAGGSLNGEGIGSAPEPELFRSNTFEGGTDGVEITPANSGGASGDAFDAGATGAGGELPRFSDEQSVSGGLSAKSVHASRHSDLRWVLSNETEVYSRFYVRFHTMTGAVNDEIYVVQGGFPIFDWWISLVDVGSGDIRLGARDAFAGGDGLAEMDTSLPENSWFRLEIHVAQAGTYEVRLFLDMHSTTPTETLAGTTPETTSNGLVRAFASNWSHTNTDSVAYIDDFALSLDDWIGPSGESEPETPQGSGGTVAIGSIEAEGSTTRSGSGDALTTGHIEGSGVTQQSGFGDIESVGHFDGAGLTARTGSGDTVAVGGLEGTGSVPPNGPESGHTFTSGSDIAQDSIVIQTPSGSGDIAAVGDLEGVGTTERHGSGDTDAVGSLEGEGSAPVSTFTSGSVVAQATVDPPTSPSGFGDVTAVGALEGSGASNRRGSGSSTTEGVLEGHGTTQHTGSSDATAVGLITKHGQSADGGGGTIAAVADIVAAGSTDRSGSGSVSGVGALEAAGATTRSGAGSVSAEGHIDGHGATQHSGHGDLTAATVVEGSGSSAGGGSGQVAAQAAIEATGFSTRRGDGSVTGVADAEGNGTTQRSGSGSVDAEASITGNGLAVPVPGSGGFGSIESIGVTEGSGFTDRSGSGEVTAVSDNQGDAIIFTSGQGEVVGFGIVEGSSTPPGATIFLKTFVTFLPSQLFTTVVPDVVTHTDVLDLDVVSEVPVLDLHTTIPVLAVHTVIPSLDIVTNIED